MKRHRLTFAIGAALAVLVFTVCAALGYPLAGLAGGALPLIGMSQYDDSDIVRQLAAWGVLDKEGGLLKRIKAKTADYTIIASTTDGGDLSGTIFTNRGAAGTVVFTLPAPSAALAGTHFDFLTIVAQIITVATATVDTLIADNDATADSLSTSARIGVRLRVMCDGTSWIATLANGVPQAAFAQIGTVAT